MIRMKNAGRCATAAAGRLAGAPPLPRRPAGWAVWLLLLACCRLASAQMTRLVAIADTRGTSASDYVNTAVLSNAIDRILALSPPPDAVLVGGDLVATLNNPDQGFWRFTNAMARLTAAGIPYYCAIGHDDVSVLNWYALWSQTFEFPGNGPANWTELAYYVDVGAARVIVLDSVTRGKYAYFGNQVTYVHPTERAWLQTVIGAASPQPFDIVLTHRCACPTSVARSNDCLSASLSDLYAFLQILRDAQCSLLLAGHDHLYARRLLDTRYDDAWTQPLPHVVACTGASLYTNLLADTPYPPPDACNTAHHTFVVIDLDPAAGVGAARAYAVDTGEPLDEVALAGKPNTLSLSFQTRLLADNLDRLPQWGRLTLSRPVSNALAVALQSDDPATLGVTNAVTIPAGTNAAAFDLQLYRRPVPAGPRTVAISAQTASGLAATATVEVADTGGDPPRLSFAAPSAVDRYTTNLHLPRVSAPYTTDFSGCALSPDGAELLVVCRGGLAGYRIQVFDTNGLYLRGIALTNFDDVEGICLVDPASNRYAVVQEGAGNDISIFTLATNTAVIDKDTDAQVIHVNLPFGKWPNKALEGIVWDAANDCFYLVHEGYYASGHWYAPLALLRVAPTGETVVAEAVFGATNALDGWATDLSDLAYDPYRGRFYLLSDESHRLIECAFDGVVRATLPLPLSQPEGLALSADGATLYVVGEPNECLRLALAPPASSGPEGTTAVFAVALSRPLTNSLAVEVAISSAQAVAGSDYVPAATNLLLPPLATTGSFAVTILSDPEMEPDETLELALTNSSPGVALADQRARHVIAGDAMRLVVETPHGTAAPPAGTNWLSYLSELSCRILDSPVAAGSGTQVVCQSWSGTGSVPAAGGGTATPVFALSNDSAIVWHWTTNVWLSAAADPGGAVDGGNRWLSLGAAASVTSRPDAYFTFEGWSGDLDEADTNLAVIDLQMDRTRAVTAHFRAAVTSRGTPLWWLADFYGPTNDFETPDGTDTDGDGMAGWQEYIADTSPTDPLSALRFLSLELTEWGVSLTWPSAADRVYELYRAPDILAPPVPLDTNIPPDPWGIVRFYDLADAASNAFYRLRVRLAP